MPVTPARHQNPGSPAHRKVTMLTELLVVIYVIKFRSTQLQFLDSSEQLSSISVSHAESLILCHMIYTVLHGLLLL